MASLDKDYPWSQEDILKLLECIKKNIPSDDSRSFKKTQEDLDWGKVAFKHYSGKMCKQKWMQLSHTLRKFRTLSELVVEASEHMKQQPKRKNHPDFPKRPLTAYLRFYKEQRAKYSRRYPEYNNSQLAKLLAEKYNQLPGEVKEKYIQDFRKEKRDFEEKVTKFKRSHPDVEHSKKSVVRRSQETKVPKKSQGGMENVKSPPKTDLPKTLPSVMKFQGEPKKPPMNGYHKFHQDMWSSQELRHLPSRERWVEISRRWHKVPKSQKEHYNSQAEELQKQYQVDMDLWLNGLSSEEYTAYREAKATYGKRKNLAMSGGRSPKRGRTDQQSASAEEQQKGPGEMQGLLAPGTDSSETVQGADGGSQVSRQNMMEDGEEEDSGSSPEDSSSSSEDSSSSSEDSSSSPEDSSSSSEDSSSSSEDSSSTDEREDEDEDGCEVEAQAPDPSTDEVERNYATKDNIGERLATVRAVAT
ncbi:upstream-binding factor 1-like protein 1 [Peromyscus eremicus]|uniref:upstream-binding factor 1-like protein 1 n=1 Tax=Peromyscus eremicus TaxID=42410 RepID=UPI0027DD9D9F|nr:upstream-binding factor 1-like protein 1 [Peromyscus eremicus]